MQPSPDHDERLICAVLAAQVAAIRDHVEADATVDLLWRIADALTLLSGLVTELATLHVAADPVLEQRYDAAVAAGSEVSQSLDALAFEQAQRHDLARQKADCVVAALQRLAATDAPQGSRLSQKELAAMYISDEQHAVHKAVARRFGEAGASVAVVNDGAGTPQEGIGP
jgi:hypothetical protein